MDENAVNALVAGLVARHGRLDALVNAVGGYDAGAPLWEMETGVLDRMLALNLRSGYLLARACVPAMLKQGRGARQCRRPPPRSTPCPPLAPMSPPRRPWR